jgi:release factor glutamine methyltransferase
VTDGTTAGALTPGPDDAGAGGAERGAADAGRTSLVEAIAARVGSRQEARWIVDHGGADRALVLADRRAAGEPLQYVLGRWPFRSLELRVDRRVLIPRPETEQVVEVALAELGRSSEARGSRRQHRPLAVDLGTGAGAIALSLAREGGPLVPGLEVWATDVSAEVLEVARRNLDDLAAEDPVAAARVHLARGSWFGALPEGLAGQLDLVVSNPPYVTEAEYDGLDSTVRDWEPRLALVAERGTGGVGGMAAIEAVVEGAPRWLHPSGALVVEIAPSQAPASMDAARRAGFARVTTARDLAGRVRMLVAGS